MAFSNGPTVVTNGLVLSLDAADRNSYPGSGTTWTDMSGNGNNGTLTNGPTFSSANQGAIVFDGVDDYANFGNILNFTSEPFTFSHWFYCNTLSTNQAGQGPVIFYKGSFQVNGYYAQVNLDGSLGFRTNQSGVRQNSTTAAGVITAGIWYNASYTRLGSSIRVYINGIDTTSVADSHVNPTSSTNNFTIANYQNGFIYGNIRISSFLTYNRALTASEVLQNYNATKTRFGL